MLLISYLTYLTFTFNHLADAFIQSDLQMRTIEAIKINKRTVIYSILNDNDTL